MRPTMEDEKDEFTAFDHRDNDMCTYNPAPHASAPRGPTGKFGEAQATFSGLANSHYQLHAEIKRLEAIIAIKDIELSEAYEQAAKWGQMWEDAIRKLEIAVFGRDYS